MPINAFPSIPTVDAQLQYSSSGCQATKYDRLFTKFPQLIESLANIIPPDSLANKLLSEKLITKSCWEQACLSTVPNSQRIQPLILAVLSQVKLNDANYDKFMSVLRGTSGLQAIAQWVEGV